MVKTAERELHTEMTEEYIDALVERAAAAQKEFQTWSEEATDRLLYALARCVYLHAEELAIAAVQETRMGNIRDKTALLQKSEERQKSVKHSSSSV